MNCKEAFEKWFDSDKANVDYIQAGIVFNEGWNACRKNIVLDDDIKWAAEYISAYRHRDNDVPSHAAKCIDILWLAYVLQNTKEAPCERY